MNQKRKPRILSSIFLLFASIGVTLILLEIILRLFFPVTDFPVVEFEEDLGVHLRPNQEGMATLGPFGTVRADYHINGAGWNSPHEYSTEKPDDTLRVAVIGDSYVEALQVDVEDSFPVLAENILQSEPACNQYDTIEVYGFGYSGAPLSQYLNMMDYVARTYSPDIYVITIVHNDFEQSFRSKAQHPHFLHFEFNEDGELVAIPPEPYTPSSFRRFLNEFALVRYLYINLKVGQLFEPTDPYAVVAQGIQADQRDSIITEDIRELTLYIFSEYRRIAEENNAQLLLIMDANRLEIYGEESEIDLDLYNQLAGEITDELDIDFIDLTDTFTADYAQYGEPFNSELDAHWNERGHRIVAEAVSDWIISNRCTANP